MKNVICSFFGHEFQVTKRVTLHVKEFKCRNCNKQFTTDQSGNITRLTSRHKEINEVLEMMYQKKLRRKSLKSIL